MLKDSSFNGGVLGRFFATAQNDYSDYYERQKSVMLTISPRPLWERDRVRGKKVAFTLAEVLITLGIIGVVAALTLPTLISNYKKQTYVTGLQKAYSVLNNVTKDAMSSDDVTDFSDTQLMQLWKDAVPKDYGSAKYMAFANELKKYYPNAELLNMTSPYNILPLVYSEKETGKKDSNYHLFKTGAGILFAEMTCLQNQDSILYCFSLGLNCPQGATDYSENFFSPANGTQMNMDHILVDVNGFKKPNQLGRDMFVFTVGYKNGIVYPAGSRAINDEWGRGMAQNSCRGLSGDNLASCSNAMMNQMIGYYNSATQKNNYCFNTEAQKKPEGLNLYCADKIIKEGWKMNY